MAANNTTLWRLVVAARRARKIGLVGASVGILFIAAACGGGGGSSAATPTAATPTVPPSPAASPSTVPASVTPNPALVAQGQALFQANCAVCHRSDASGGMRVGDDYSADLRWNVLGPTYHDDPSLVARAVLQGKDEDGNSLDPEMPRWQGKLTSQQVQAIVAYLQTLH